jgi:hypothetical protein
MKERRGKSGKRRREGEKTRREEVMKKRGRGEREGKRSGRTDLS